MKSQTHVLPTIILHNSALLTVFLLTVISPAFSSPLVDISPSTNPEVAPSVLPQPPPVPVYGTSNQISPSAGPIEILSGDNNYFLKADLQDSRVHPRVLLPNNDSGGLQSLSGMKARVEGNPEWAIINGDLFSGNCGSGVNCAQGLTYIGGQRKENWSQYGNTWTVRGNIGFDTSNNVEISVGDGQTKRYMTIAGGPRIVMGGGAPTCSGQVVDYGGGVLKTLFAASNEWFDGNVTGWCTDTREITLLGYSADRRYLYMGISKGGKTVTQLAQWLKDRGAYEILRLDSGSSSGMYYNGQFIGGTGSKAIANAFAIVTDSSPPPSSCPGPSLNSPSDGYISSDPTITFYWNAPSGCTFSGYTFRIKDTPSMDSGGNTIVDAGEANTQHTSTIGSQWYNTDLYWGVRTANPLSPNWSVRRFRIQPNDPPPPSGCTNPPRLIAPGDGETYTTRTITFVWMSPNGCSPNGYTFRISQDGNPEQSIWDTGVSDTQYTYSLNKDGTFYWHVRACQPCSPYQPGPWATASFTINTSPPSPPWTVTLSASNTLVTLGTGVTLNAQTNQDVGPTPYYIFIINQTAGQTVSRCDFGTTCSATVTEYSPTSQTFVAMVASLDGSAVQATSSPKTVAWTASPPPPPTCTDDATFVTDVTIPPGTQLSPGQSFTKIWQMLNSGTCAWTSGYSLNFVGGWRSTGQIGVYVTGVPPGSPVNIATDQVAPSSPGTYTGYWRMNNAAGRYFGPTVTLQIDVVMAPPSDQVTVDYVWTSAGTANWSTTMTTFRPGDPIRYLAAVNNRTGQVARVHVVWEITGQGGRFPGWEGDLDTGPGIIWWALPRTISQNALAGSYNYRLSVTYKGQLSSRNTLFDVLMPYGMAITGVRDPGGLTVSSALPKTRALGFGYVLVYASWASLEPAPGQYNWNDPSTSLLDDILKQCEDYGLKPVMRIDRAPSWARPAGSHERTPPRDPAYLYNFMNALVSKYGTRFGGYIIWNEPNTPFEWGGQSPNANAFMALLQAAYNGAKAANPAATIVSPGLAPTAGGSGAVNDLVFLQQMYNAGLKNYSDVLGMNSLGFKYSPDDTGDPNSLNFSRLVSLRNIMVRNGDNGKKAWALEVGWLRDSNADLGIYNWMKVSQQQQADYLRRALQKARTEWPWLQIAFIWNLDFNKYYPPTSEKYWFSIDGTQAYDNLRDLQKYRALLPSVLNDASGGW